MLLFVLVCIRVYQIQRLPSFPSLFYPPPPHLSTIMMTARVAIFIAIVATLIGCTIHVEAGNSTEKSKGEKNDCEERNAVR